MPTRSKKGSQGLRVPQGPASSWAVGPKPLGDTHRDAESCASALVAESRDGAGDGANELRAVIERIA